MSRFLLKYQTLRLHRHNPHKNSIFLSIFFRFLMRPSEYVVIFIGGEVGTMRDKIKRLSKVGRSNQDIHESSNASQLEIPMKIQASCNTYKFDLSIRLI